MFILTPKETWLRTQKKNLQCPYLATVPDKEPPDKEFPRTSLYRPLAAGPFIPKGASLILKITVISNHVHPTCSWKWTLSTLQLSMVTSKYLEEPGSRHFQLWSCSLAHTRSAVSVTMSSRLEKYKPIKISSRLHQTDLAIFENEGAFFSFFFCATTTPESFLCFLFQVLATQLQNIYWNEKQVDPNSSAICDTEQFKRGKKTVPSFYFL